MSTPSSSDAFRIDVSEAEQLISAAMPAYGTRRVALAAAANQILRQTIVAERDQPPFDRATMDGIAIASAALDSEVREFRVAGIQAAGQASATLPDTNHCLETMTGAVLPAGSDTIIPVERISIDEGEDEGEGENKDKSIARLEDGYQPEPGQFVHRQASDHSRDDALIHPGVRIGAPEMAILTAAGNAEVDIAAWPSIAVISTGDELVDVGDAMADFQIRSSNDRAIETAFLTHGCTSSTRSRLPDDPQALLEHIRKLHDDNDVLILSGGL
jgi:molybdopterin molybdotransferase